MPKFAAETFEASEKVIVYGLSVRTCERTLQDDILALSDDYYTSTGFEPKNALPLYIIYDGFEQKRRGKEYNLFIGGEKDHELLHAFVLPQGMYAKTIIKPRFGSIWGPSVASAKRSFYSDWLPAYHEWEAGTICYERHDEKSISDAPEANFIISLKAVDPNAPKKKALPFF